MTQPIPFGFISSGFSELGQGGQERITEIDPRNEANVTLPQFTADYDTYLIELSNLICPVDHELQGEVSTDGVNFPGGTLQHSSLGRGTRTDSATFHAVGYINFDDFNFSQNEHSSPGANLFDIQGGERYSGHIWVFDPLGNTSFTYCLYQLIFENDIVAGNIMGGYGVNAFTAITPVTNLRLAPLGAAPTNWSDVPDQRITLYGMEQ